MLRLYISNDVVLLDGLLNFASCPLESMSALGLSFCLDGLFVWFLSLLLGLLFWWPPWASFLLNLDGLGDDLKLLLVVLRNQAFVRVKWIDLALRRLCTIVVAGLFTWHQDVLQVSSRFG